MHFATKTVLALALSTACTAALAGAFPIKLPLGGSKDSAATTSAANDAAGDPAVAQDGMVRTFVASQLEVLAAQHELALAYDLKDQAAILASEQASLSSGGTLEAKALQTSMERSEAANAAIAEKQAQQATLSEEGKQHYVNSLPHFAKGVVGTRQLLGEVTHFTSSMKASATGGGLAGLGGGMTKLKAGMVIAKGTPSYSKSVFDMFRKTLSIGQSNGVKAPADATSALAGL
jgi:hypothetical protein